MKEIEQMLADFIKDRPVMAEANTPDFLKNAILNEVIEFIKGYEKNPKSRETEAELADIIIYSITLMQELGIDPELAIREKIGLNIARYPANRFQTGDYQTSRINCKRESKNITEDFYT